MNEWLQVLAPLQPCTHDCTLGMRRGPWDREKPMGGGGMAGEGSGWLGVDGGVVAQPYAPGPFLLPRRPAPACPCPAPPPARTRQASRPARTHRAPPPAAPTRGPSGLRPPGRPSSSHPQGAPPSGSHPQGAPLRLAPTRGPSGSPPPGGPSGSPPSAPLGLAPTRRRSGSHSHPPGIRPAVRGSPAGRGACDRRPRPARRRLGDGTAPGSTAPDPGPERRPRRPAPPLRLTGGTSGVSGDEAAPRTDDLTEPSPVR